MKAALTKVISLLVFLAHTTGLCFASHSPQILETRNWQLETDGGSPLWKGGGGNAAGGLSLTYDALGKVAQTFLSAFSYDALGNRVVADTKLWIPNHSDSLKRPLMECDSNGNVLRYYIWGDNRLLGFIDANNNLTVAHCDDFGSVITLTDLSGNVLYSANYGPHGEDWGSTGFNPTPFAWLGGYGVQYLETDTPLRLYLTRHRVYSATLNRFLSADPMGLAGGSNLYAYGEGNPMAYIDPLGLCASGGINWGDIFTRIGGGLKMIGGAAEAAAGYVFGFVTSETVIGAIGGTAVGLHGTDVMVSGARTMWNGAQTDSFTSQGLQAAGMSQGWANGVDTGISVVGSLGVGLAAKAAQTAPAAYRAVDPNYATSTANSGIFYQSGAAGRLGNDGIYANSTIKGAVAEFQYHNPGITPAVFKVNYPVSPTLKINPPSGYFNQPLPFTQGVNILEAPSLRVPGTINYLIREGAVPGLRVQ